MRPDEKAHQKQSVDDGGAHFLWHEGAGQGFEQAEKQPADDRARRIPHAADDDDHEGGDNGVLAHGWREEADWRDEGSGRRRYAGRSEEGQRADARDIDADDLRGEFALGDGPDAAPDERTTQNIFYGEQD